MEPLESLRYAAWLSPDGALVTAAEPFINIPDYPELAGILTVINGFPLSRVVDAAALAKEAGLARAVNMVMVGAASPFLPIKENLLEKAISETFAAKEPAVAEGNRKAFQLGRRASSNAAI
jgi:indolepyruvate ferredoxin oxidoreductase beta subunit